MTREQAPSLVLRLSDSYTMLGLPFELGLVGMQIAD